MEADEDDVVLEGDRDAETSGEEDPVPSDVEVPQKSSRPLFILSGGAGFSGDAIVRTALAQFPKSEVPVIRIPLLRSEKEIDEALECCASSEPLAIVHTFVSKEMRLHVIEECEQRHLVNVDLLESLMPTLADRLTEVPLGVPGRYRKLRGGYFRRIEAINFAIKHDDGLCPSEWSDADVMLLGVSHCGKTPLTVYLSFLGLKAGNCPIVYPNDFPSELDEIDSRRIIGLDIDPEVLTALRKQREFGVLVSGYATLEGVFEEVEFARKILKQRGVKILNVTNRPIESTARDIEAHLISHFGGIFQSDSEY